ncbi:MAG: carboxylating nicotinate-nucleotide diphosphorylase [Gammaproteobacteria bacterium]|nr:carboxylating nicotinate-nucleotide diphosphorylase [Gammaproteobacteria bacterium]
MKEELQTIPGPDLSMVQEDVRRALAEDVGSGDVTARLVPAELRAEGVVISREAAVLCGQVWLEEVFEQLGGGVTVEWALTDGAPVIAGQTLCRLHGPARTLLTGERTALNFLQTLSGTATRAAAYRARIGDLPAILLDTRKTLPGLRHAQKYAVRCGGGANHRLGLYDGILIKENHIATSGSITRAIENARALGAGLPIETEVEDLDGAAEAIAAGADIVLLDNFDLDTLREAVARHKGQALLEASGGITLDNIRAIALTGVDRISIGALTKDVFATDLSMRLHFVR